jgi:hypothetical protein
MEFKINLFIESFYTKIEQLKKNNNDLDIYNHKKILDEKLKDYEEDKKKINDKINNCNEILNKIKNINEKIIYYKNNNETILIESLKLNGEKLLSKLKLDGKIIEFNKERNENHLKSYNLKKEEYDNKLNIHEDNILKINILLDKINEYTYVLNNIKSNNINSSEEFCIYPIGY